MYHSTPPAELMIPVTAHLELVDELAKGASGQVQQRLLRNHSQVALVAGRLSFFDLRDPMAARAYYSMALDSSREAGDPQLSAATLGHMSFVSAAGSGFSAAIDLLEGADKLAAKATVLPSWLAAVEAEIRAKAGDSGLAQRHRPCRGRTGRHPRRACVDGLLRRDSRASRASSIWPPESQRTLAAL
jgi:hypothetical protein